MACTTQLCLGDDRYSAPGRGHAPWCHYPQPYEPEWDRDADEELGYIFQPDWWPPSP